MAEAVRRSAAWAGQCKQVWQGGDTDRQALFGIQQGGLFADLRARSVEQIVALDLPGYAVPTHGDFPFVLDISLSAVAGGKLLLASKKGERIPLNWATDKEGRPTDDPDTGIRSTILHADGSLAKALYTAAPGSALGRMDMVCGQDIDEGRVHFRMDGKAVFESATRGMTDAAFESLEVNGLTLDDIDLLIPHQPNLRLLETMVEMIGIDPEKVFINVEEYGNMASACLPIAFDEARKNGMAGAGKLVLLVAFGSGFVWASSLLRM